MSAKSTKINYSKIGIAGAGGIGAFLAANLFDYGAKRNQFNHLDTTIDIYDDDLVDASNTLHQNYYEEDIGKRKVDVVSDRCVGTINAVPRFMTEQDFANYDVIFSAVDSMTFRKALYIYGFAHPELFWIDGRCSSRQMGLFHSRLEQEQLVKHISDDDQRAGCLLAYDKKNQTSHVTPQIVAGMMMQTFLNYIRGDLQLDPVIIIL